MWEARNSGLQRWRMFSTLSAITTPIVQKKKKRERHCIEKQNKQRKMPAAHTIVLSLIAPKILKERINEVLKMKR